MSCFLVDGNVDIDTRIRSDNSSVVEHVRSINTVAKERMPNGLLESNRGEMETNPWLVLSHIAGPLNISDEMAKSAIRKKLILSAPRDISQAISGKERMI